MPLSREDAHSITHYRNECKGVIKDFLFFPLGRGGGLSYPSRMLPSRPSSHPRVGLPFPYRQRGRRGSPAVLSFPSAVSLYADFRLFSAVAALAAYMSSESFL